MINHGLVVDVLLASSKKQSVQMRFGVFVIQTNLQVVSNPGGVYRDGVGVEMCIATDVGISCLHQGRVFGLFQQILLHAGFIHQGDLRNGDDVYTIGCAKMMLRFYDR